MFVHEFDKKSEFKYNNTNKKTKTRRAQTHRTFDDTTKLNTIIKYNH